MARHVRKGDTVIVNSGSHKGQTGTITKVITGEPGQERVLIKGLNLRTKHLRPTRFNPQGGIVTREASIHISNVNPVVDGKASRVRFIAKSDGSKARTAVIGGGELGIIRGPEAKKHAAAGRKHTKAAPKATTKKSAKKPAAKKTTAKKPAPKK